MTIRASQRLKQRSECVFQVLDSRSVNLASSGYMYYSTPNIGTHSPIVAVPGNGVPIINTLHAAGIVLLGMLLRMGNTPL